MKTFELQMTQIRHPKSFADRWTDGWMNRPMDGQMDRWSGPTTRPAFANLKRHR